MQVMTGWHAVAEADELPADTALLLRRFGVLWRLHRDAAGDPVCQRAPGGDPALLRRGVPALACVEWHGFVWVWVGLGPVGQPELPWFDDLRPERLRVRLVRERPVGVDACIEAVLARLGLAEPADFANLGGDRRAPTLTQDPRGFRVERPAAAAGESAQCLGQMLYPNLWRRVVSPSLMVMVAFVAVDRCSTRLYIRAYAACAEPGAPAATLPTPATELASRYVEFG